jgi:hypothetical protein
MPSAQHEDEAGKQDHRQYMITVGIGRAVPTATIGIAYICRLPHHSFLFFGFFYIYTYL